MNTTAGTGGSYYPNDTRSVPSSTYYGTTGINAGINGMYQPTSTSVPYPPGTDPNTTSTGGTAIYEGFSAPAVVSPPAGVDGPQSSVPTSQILADQANPPTASTAAPAPTPSAPVDPTAGVLSGPGYGEDWYAQYGNDINQPTNTQKMFDMGPGAMNPMYDNAIDMTNRQINAQTAARGIYDGSAAIGSIGLADAALRGQQLQDYEKLGTTADAANQGAYTAGSNAANAAQNETTSRVNAIVGGQTQLSTAAANTIDNFYQMAESGQLTADMASIEAQIQASGVDAATAQAIANDLTSLAGSGIKAASSGK